MQRLLGIGIGIVLAVSACSSSGGQPSGRVVVDMAEPPDLEFTNDAARARPYGWQAPATWMPGEPRPLVVLLHGYGVNGKAQNAYFGLTRLVDDERFFLAFPDGVVDSRGLNYWNADSTPAGDAGYHDDLEYLDALIDDMAKRFPIDARRVYLVGHSNGAFMAYHYACRRSSRVAAIATLAGGNWSAPGACEPTSEVAVIAMHGDADDTIPYEGGEILDRPFPSATQSIRLWARYDGCSDEADTSAPPLDLLTGESPETTVERWTGCRAGGAELWTMHGGGHIPGLSRGFAPTLWAALSRFARK